MIFELVRELVSVLGVMPNRHPLYQILIRLDEAFRHDAQFINQHPTTLFQVLRNNLLPSHTSENDCGPQSDIAAVDSAITQCLTRWYDVKQCHTPGFVWVRNHGPLHRSRGLIEKLTLNDPDEANTVSFDVSAVHFLQESRQLILTSSFELQCRCLSSTSVFKLRQHDGEIQDSLIVAGNKLLVALSDGTVRTLTIPALVEVDRWRLEPFYGGPMQIVSNGEITIERGQTRGYHPVLWMRDRRRMSRDVVYGPPSLAQLDGVIHVRATGEGRYVALVHEDGSVRCVETVTRKEIWRTSPFEHSIESLVSDASAHFAVREEGGGMAILRAADGQVIWRRQRPEGIAKHGLICLSSDGKFFAWQAGFEVAVCQVKRESEPQQRFSFAEAYSPITSMTICDDQGYDALITCHQDRTIRFWNLKIVTAHSEHRGQRGIDAAGGVCRIRSIVLSESGADVVSVATDGSLILWNPDSAQPRWVLHGEPQFVPLVAISGNGELIAWTPRNDEIHLVSASNGAFLERFKITQPNSVTLSRDGDGIGYARSDGRVTWQQHSSAAAVNLSGEHDPILHIVASNHCRWLAGVTQSGEIVIWDLYRNILWSRLSLGADLFPQSVRFSPDEGRLVISSWKGGQIEYDIASDRIIQRFDILQDVPFGTVALTSFRMRRTADGHEFVSVLSDKPVAWTPISRTNSVNLDEWTWLAAPRTNGRTWVFAAANQIHFVSLEGNLPEVNPGLAITSLLCEGGDALASLSRSEISEIRDVLRQRQHLGRLDSQRKFLDRLSKYPIE